VTVLCTSLLALGSALVLAGAATGEAGKKAGSPISGTWKANGTVVVARHISDANVGDHFTVNWTITHSCSGGCETVLHYGHGSHHLNVPLQGHGKRWSGTLTHQVFPCTHGGTAIGSISFKLSITHFVKHHKQRVADAMTGTGKQVGKGCASIKEVVDFKATRLGF
jgi:hypothetical protein